MADKKRLTPEDVIAFNNVSDAQISPDGDRIAFVVGDTFKTDTKWAKSGIWIVETDRGEPQPFMGGPRTDVMPRWSPDGRMLAFASDRVKDGQHQIYMMSSEGGEARALTDLKGAISAPRGLNALQWFADATSLAFLMEDPKLDEEKKKEKGKDDAIEFEQNPKYIRLWTVGIESGEVQCVSPDNLQIWEFALHPAKPEVAAVVSDVPYEWAWYSNRLVSFELSGPAQEHSSVERQVGLPGWSPDGSRLAFVSSTWSDRGCTSGEICSLDAKSGEVKNHTEGMAVGLGGMNWTSDGMAMYAIGHEDGGTGIYRVPVDGTDAVKLWWGQVGVTEPFSPTLTRSANGAIAIIREDADNPRDVWLVREEGEGLEWTQLTHLHPQAAGFEIGKTEVFRWKGADGWDLQGLVISPVGDDSGKPVPLVMNVHGGPTGVSGSRYNASFGWNQLLASEGCAVFMPNYRGSVGWGRTFSESNLGDMGGKDWEDMILGIDALIDADIADPDRLAITGWSYGGFIAAWAISQTDRFKASVMGAGISHWLSFHGKSCLSDWDQMYYQANPYDSDGLYQKFSPVTYWDNLKTPTLILHGEIDQDVPVEQSYLFHRALKDKGVPTELVVYPREPHGVTERVHILDMSRRVVSWMKKYLGLGD